MPSPTTSSPTKILLLEGVSLNALNSLTKQGFEVEYHKKALPKDILLQKIPNFHAIGIRSKTQITREILDAATNLQTIGCFCIGTNQVDLDAATQKGIVVFNSPFSNSRSVAELVLGEIIALSRQLGDRNSELHNGIWNKVSNNSKEIRGKTLGIVGYGHIGTQLSVLADAMGMKVNFYDSLSLMPLGTAKPLASLQELLMQSDYITLHVPETPETKNMISEKELSLMKKGSILINASRGSVVDIPALAKFLKNGHLAGCAVDVYPHEPFANGPNFHTELQGCPNTILTPHIGGSTEEAQFSIGVEVSNALSKFLTSGCSMGAVNLPEIDLKKPVGKNTVRIVNFHNNVPGVLKQINKILSDFNIEKQTLDSKGPVSYLMADLSLEDLREEELSQLHSDLNSINENILTRIF
ncbi:hypothetical protein HK099_002270 [Clydaea vesicula]|uniref:Phosphoglycerate dehydrogenase n=1 Tax=Clydaea vesicula TaxID=447962 RepID=A0AAD5U4D8_9FUNG|nr:hypothetical protein HK099_002270 [Clydaea vesicula]KAJ3385357.1 hypothetical protein HDU92_003093 [Lobulomyces angularis]